jgi:hypothetical protein
VNAGRLLRALTDGEVRFIVVGGIAAVAQGVPFVTFDVDVVHERSPENVQRLLAVLSGIDAVYVRPSGSPPIVPRADLLLGDGHHILTSVYGRLDVLGRIEGGRGYEELLPFTVGSRVGDAAVRLLSIETILEIKRASPRPKDRAIVPLLEAVLRRRSS